VPAWVLGTLGIQLMVPTARAPKVWGVPLVPWLPSLSIATNLFLMGSLGSVAFVRFGVCTAIMLIYYVLVGLHATYDVANDEDEGIDYSEDNTAESAGEKATVKTADVEKASAGDGER
jgi:APA family basic amino acid/polyamine antiporter